MIGKYSRAQVCAGQVDPAYVGGDIGCGMQVYALQDRDLDCSALDDAIRRGTIHGHADGKVRI